MIGFLISLMVLVLLAARWLHLSHQHQRRLQQLPLRIHVNGIRGKSTVTRLVAGVLREGGFNTLAKTTGSAARVIFPDGGEAPIRRLGAATITEQIRIIEQHVTPATEAMVMECMAVNPLYQKITQEKIVCGNIVIITNVREDHQDLMGVTLEEIADSLATTIPHNGLVITAESREDLRARLAHYAEQRGSRLLYADPAWVQDSDLARFEYLSFKDNLAIGFAIAQAVGIPREVALRGMEKSAPDIGVVRVAHLTMGGKPVIWAPLFAVNDRESTVISLEALRPYHRPDAIRIGILNNRHDRAMRALQFADIAARDLGLDYYVTFGAYERQVTERMVEQGFPASRILNLGDSRKPTLDEILAAIGDIIDGEEALLVGLVNIHTEQAEMLLHYVEEKTQNIDTTADPLIAQVVALPPQHQRQRYVATHVYQARLREMTA